MAFLTQIDLKSFRNYDQARLEGLESGFIFLFGANGAGKTNLLEAVSLLAPGRGLRGARISDMQKSDHSDPWSVAARVQGDWGTVRLGTGRDPATDKRLVRVDGDNVRSQSRLGDYLSCVWLTPQMDGLFTGSASARRRFFDRLILSFDPAHGGRLSRYENALAQRARLLKDGTGDAAWLSGLEIQMAETGIALAAARQDMALRLTQIARAQTDQLQAHFPLADLALEGQIENALQTRPALEVEAELAEQLAQCRERDARQGGAGAGPHRTDWRAIYVKKNMPAHNCSTGEQKALLIGIVLAHAKLIHNEQGACPILLLDEVAAHLDEQRRDVLLEYLANLGGQTWITGTESALFSKCPGPVSRFRIDNGSRLLKI